MTDYCLRKGSWTEWSSSSWSTSILLLLCLFFFCSASAIQEDDAYYEPIDKEALRDEAREMFFHGYNSYMRHAWPADELMPLACAGRRRGITPSRGDVDDALGNFSLTLVDALDTLVVMGEFDEFEDSVRRIVETVRFDSDLIVSVFETNIRMVGGLLSGHVLAEMLQTREPTRLRWYDKQLLRMAAVLANRLLPAFNTTSGLPYSRINLRHGMQEPLQRQRDTCTACGGTMLLEFAALSRLTNDPIYERAAKKAMDFLWAQRHRGSDLMGTVLNVQSGDWVRRDSGIGAGIDSYYEYLLKAYILLGESSFLDRFEAHYTAIGRYVSKGPLFVDVHMHRPTVASKSYMDALLAFWPGLQVLKGDLREAIETHEMLYQVVKRHKFLPEAFTHNLQVWWAEHPLRPEFTESTYFLYRATQDDHYLRVARQVMRSLNKNVRVPCGFAGIKDIRVMTHEDRMDSFVLSETFKYLYLIFAEPSELPFHPDDYVMTTEAHFLPLSIADWQYSTPDTSTPAPSLRRPPRRLLIEPNDVKAHDEDEGKWRSAGPPLSSARPSDASAIRLRTQQLLEEIAHLQQQSQRGDDNTCPQKPPPATLRPAELSLANEAHVRELRAMGIEVVTAPDGRLQLVHHHSLAASPEQSVRGVEFLTELRELTVTLTEKLTSARGNGSAVHESEPTALRVVQIVGKTLLRDRVSLLAAPALFGRNLENGEVSGLLILADPLRACDPLRNAGAVRGRIVIVERSDCMFQQKTRNAESAGALGVIVVDHAPGSSSSTSPLFAMSADVESPLDSTIPTVFLFHTEGHSLMDRLEKGEEIRVRLGSHSRNPSLPLALVGRHTIINADMGWCPLEMGLPIVIHRLPRTELILAVRPRGADPKVTAQSRHAIVERHVLAVRSLLRFSSQERSNMFDRIIRHALYTSLFDQRPTMEQFPDLDALLDTLDDPTFLAESDAERIAIAHSMKNRFPWMEGPFERVRCALYDSRDESSLIVHTSFRCARIPPLVGSS